VTSRSGAFYTHTHTPTDSIMGGANDSPKHIIPPTYQFWRRLRPKKSVIFPSERMIVLLSIKFGDCKSCVFFVVDYPGIVGAFFHSPATLYRVRELNRKLRANVRMSLRSLSGPYKSSARWHILAFLMRLH
jgi:hypothetical protein